MRGRNTDKRVMLMDAAANLLVNVATHHIWPMNSALGGMEKTLVQLQSLENRRRWVLRSSLKFRTQNVLGVSLVITVSDQGLPTFAMSFEIHIV